MIPNQLKALHFRVYRVGIVWAMRAYNFNSQNSWKVFPLFFAIWRKFVSFPGFNLNPGLKLSPKLFN